MGALELIAVFVVGGVAAACWRLHRYPGGWSFAFSDVHRADRADLDDARGAVRSLQERARKELVDAQAALDRAVRSYQHRVTAPQRELERLRRPGRGSFVADLGGLSLYEHELVVSGEEIPLAGLQARFEQGRTSDCFYIYLTRSDGRVRMERFAGSVYAEDDVRCFSVRIQNAAAAEDRFRQQRGEAMRHAKAELEEAQADTGPRETARAHLDTVTARHNSDEQLAWALTELEAARDRWEELTGRRPR